LDYFHDAETLVGRSFEADRATLEASHYMVNVTVSQPGFVRAIVARDGDATKVEWAHDSSWRFMPPIADPRVGFRLHPLDLAINKVLALAGRDEPRDFLDVIYVHRNYLSFGSHGGVLPSIGDGPMIAIDPASRRLLEEKAPRPIA
jgi:hypothetical protein